MADQVQYHLEAMLPELQDLEHRGIFTQPEIKAIIKRRTAHEYAIHRRIPKRSDYLQYIDYEINLEKLRRKRKQRLGLDRAPRDRDKERAITLSDYSILRRIHTLYQKMLKKFKGDVSLWIRYFDWCKEVRSTKALGRSFATAIQLHPTKPVFWIMAAAWEFEENSNVSAARILLQRGLRINPTDSKMWIEYFKIEMLWVEKLKARRRVLFKEDLDALVDSNTSAEKDAAVAAAIASANASDEAAEKNASPTDKFKPDGFTEDDDEDLMDDNDENDDENNDQNEGVNVPDLEVEQGLASTSLDNDESIVAHQTKDIANNVVAKKTLTPLQQALLDIAIPRAIYRNAIKAIPSDLSFRFSFIDLYLQFGKSALVGLNDVYASIEQDFAFHPEALAKLAERHLAFIDPLDPELPAAIKKSVTAFGSYLETHPSSELWMKYIEFLSTRRSSTEEPILVRYFDILHQRACAAAHDSGLATIPIYLAWIAGIDAAAGSKNSSETLGVFDKALEAIPTSSVLWIEKASRMTNAQDKITTLRNATASVSAMERGIAWKTYCQALIDTAASDVDIDAAFKTALSPLHLGNTPDASMIISQYIDWAHTIRYANDVASFRHFCTELIRSKPVQPLALYNKCIEIETARHSKQVAEDALEKDVQETLSVLGKLWESAVQTDRKNVDLWISYIQYANNVAKDASLAARLYWVACKDTGKKAMIERRLNQEVLQQ